jgi:hypothetical protein
MLLPLFLPAALLVNGAVLNPDSFRHHVDFFNGMVKEEVVNHFPDSASWDWMKSNIPLFSCPDPDIERIYYFRWWTYRKHIKSAPAGYIVTEFLKPVKHATGYNALSCALGLHIAEGRWLETPDYIDQYIRFWLYSGDGGGLQKHYHQFSNWTASAAYDRWLADRRTDYLVSLLPGLLADYRAWESERRAEGGLFWQRDVSDGMEDSISGGRAVKNLRPSVNSYMYGNARAIAAIARLAGRPAVAREYDAKAGELKRLVQARLWDTRSEFFETVRESGDFAGVREQIGYTPWLFNLPDSGKSYEKAWAQLMDPRGFLAPYGPTTAEQRHPEFKIADSGDDCQWNGPSWPFATTITLSALANVLNGYKQDTITPADYFKTFQIYTKSQHIQLEDGRVIPWIDENLNPYTGEWWARKRKILKGTFYGRGDHYNHSGYADLVITGLVGIRPRADDGIEVNPLVPGAWDWFCLDRVPYHGRHLTILWDRDGKHYKKGSGFRIYADGREIARSLEPKHLLASPGGRATRAPETGSPRNRR